MRDRGRGSEATPAELDVLGRAVMAEVGHVTIVSEHRHELGGHTETSLHQVRMDVPQDSLPPDGVEAEWTRDRLLRMAEPLHAAAFLVHQDRRLPADSVPKCAR